MSVAMSASKRSARGRPEGTVARPAARPSSRAGSQARAAIAAAAAAVIGEGGLEQATIAHVAARANVAKASVLYHFGDRDALLAAAVDAGLGGCLAAQLAALRATGDPRAALDAWLLAAFDASLPTLRLRLQVGSGPGGAALDWLTARDREIETALVALLDRGHRHGCWRAPRPASAALLATALVEGALASALRSGESAALAALRPLTRGALLDLLVRS